MAWRELSPSQHVVFECSVLPSVNYAMQQNDVPVIHQLVVRNASRSEIRDFVVEVGCSPGFAETWQRQVTSLAPGGALDLGVVDLTLTHDFLGTLTERVRGEVTVRAGQDGQLLGLARYDLDVLAYDEWNGSQVLPEILAAFVTPNHPAVEGVLSEAARLLGEWTGDSSLSGYQTGDRQRVLTTTAAIFAALKSLGLRYAEPPASFEATGQKIRLPDRLLEYRLGTCLDLAMMAASCLEQAGLHPLVVFTDGHAFAGVWLTDDCFVDCGTEDVLRLRKRVELGEIAVFEATLLTVPTPVPLEQAEQEAWRRLAEVDEFRLVIDIQRARRNRIRPLPLRARVDQGSARTGGPSEFAASVPSLPTAIPAVDETAPRDGLVSRLDRWKRRLLDLTLRNRLLNFRETKKSLPILCADLAAWEDALAEGEGFTVFPAPAEMAVESPRAGAVHRRRTGDDLPRELLADELAARRLRSALPKDETDRRLLEIYREARSSLEENGANTLYLALGFLVWRESTGQTDRLAPLLLLPLEIQRRSLREGFTLRRGDDEPLVNATLIEMLDHDHQLRVAGLDPLPRDERGVDVRQVMQRFRRAVRDIDGWDIREAAVIGLFSFTKFLMWRDLEVRAEDLQRNRVVAHLVHTPNDVFSSDGEWPDADRLDETHPPTETFCPLEADSSQLAAIYAAAEGRTFVLHGPPGTGKSQTIANLIAHCLAVGKTVLFVSEKAAALNVVRHRLDECGLGPFCLELHSNRAQKRAVIQQLGEALDFGARQPSDDWRREADRVAELRRKLNAYVEALHQPRATEESVFAALSRLIELRESPVIDLDWPTNATITRDGLEHLRQVVRELAWIVGEIGDPGQSIWLAATCDDWSPLWLREVEQALDRLSAAVAPVRAALATAAPMFGLVPDELSLADLGSLYALADVLPQLLGCSTVWLRSRDWPHAEGALVELVAHGRVRDGLRAEWLVRYDAAVLELELDGLLENLQGAAAAGWWRRRRANRLVCRSLASKTKPGYRIPKRALLDEVAGLCQLRLAEQAAGAAVARCRDKLAGVWDEAEADWHQLAALTSATAAVRRALAQLAAGHDGRADALANQCALLVEQGLATEAIGALQSYRAAISTLLQARQEVERRLSLRLTRAWGEKTDPGHLARLAATAKSWRENTPQLQLWCRWRRCRGEAKKVGLGALVAACEAGRLPAGALVGAFERAFALWFVTVTTDSQPALRGFLRQDFERRIEQFRRADERYTDLTRTEIQARVASRIPRSGTRTSENSEMGILLRQRLRQRGHLSVRSLFAQIPNLLPMLKPCLLMSPLSVAQYLDPAHPPFDLVVFDEASQIPVWDAIGAIARGRELVVVGDPKQLPPTSFFDRQQEDGDDVIEDGLVEDLESILDDCLAARLPEQHLRWHYRSRHESLIAFSNQQYYDNRLLTFPSPEARPAVLLRLVTGIYDKGRSRTNRVEAEAVVAEIVARLSTPAAETHSVGVVTFNLSQQRLIEDLLERARLQCPVIEPYFAEDHPEPVMVKNLESVQGDERDLILFSIGYGPDAQGRVSMNFGPLNRSGGERRLNVAITRARCEVIVFSSLRADQIDLSRVRGGGVADLKCFLDYAARGPVALAERRSLDPEAEADSPFEEAVGQALRARGHIVHVQVGCSGYRIDLAIADPDAPGRYLLGIECDGATYHRARTARDRDRLREAVLRDLGWRIHRVWSTDWWERPTKELDRIERAIEEARQAPVETTRSAPAEPADQISPAPTPVILEPVAPEPVPAYQAYQPTRQAGDLADFQLPGKVATIRAQIEEIVALEGPVSLDTVVQRVRECWGIGRAGKHVRARIEAVAQRANVLVRRSDTRTFLWPSDTDPADYRDFRRHGSDPISIRDIADIAPEELANAARQVLTEQISLPRRDLTAETARMIGVLRVTQKMEPYLLSAVDLLVRSGEAVEQAGTISLRPGA